MFELTGRDQQTISQVMFTDGQTVIKITSVSLAVALRFEKEIIKIRDEVEKQRAEKKD